MRRENLSSSGGMSSLDENGQVKFRDMRNDGDAPSVSLALPPVG